MNIGTSQYYIFSAFLSWSARMIPKATLTVIVPAKISDSFIFIDARCFVCAIQI